MKVLRFPDLEREKGLNYTQHHIWRLEKQGKFPRRIKLAGGHAVGWVEDEIDDHIREMIAERDAKV